MIVQVEIKKDKTKVKVFKYNERNRIRKMLDFIVKLKERGKDDYKVYKRDRGNNTYDISIHY